MSSPATVRSIGYSGKGTLTPLGGLCGYGDHTVPEGAVVVEPKQCENCVAIFIREKRPLESRRVKNYGTGNATEPEYSTIYVDRGERYCKNCRTNLLMPLELADYKEQLEPQLTISHSSSKLPRYDDSLMPKKRCRKKRVRLPGNAYESSLPITETIQ